jgi:hypothetical protein
MRTEHRMLSWRVTRDARVAALSDSAALLFTWLIPCADNLGRLCGEPLQVKADVGVRRAWSVDDVERMLAELHALALIDWYAVDGMRYIALPRWPSHQKLVGNMRAKSQCPPPPNVQRMTPRETTFEQSVNDVRSRDALKNEDSESTEVHSHSELQKQIQVNAEARDAREACEAWKRGAAHE